VLLQNVVYLAPKYFYDMKCLPSLVVFWFFLLAAPVVANIAPFCFHRLFFFCGFIFVLWPVVLLKFVFMCGSESQKHWHRAIEPAEISFTHPATHIL